MAGAGARAEEYYGPRGAPHGLLLAVVLGLVVAGPLFLSDGGEAVTEATVELLSPVGLLLLLVDLVLLIRVLSSGRVATALADVFAFVGSPDAAHRRRGFAGGGRTHAAPHPYDDVVLHYKSALFGGDGGYDE